jgi:hypothetical protein
VKVTKIFKASRAAIYGCKQEQIIKNQLSERSQSCNKGPRRVKVFLDSTLMQKMMARKAISNNNTLGNLVRLFKKKPKTPIFN